MKNMIEYMTTMIVTMILVFTFSTIIITGLQMLNARLIHSSAIEEIQSSYYNVSVEDLNRELDNGWNFELIELNSVNTRKDYKVILHYLIYLPVFKQGMIRGTISGYAR